jgi:hypothetical protein
MGKGKTFAQLRADIISDIEAVRYGRMSKETAAIIFQGVKELTGTINTEIAAAKLCLLTEGKAHEFGKVVRMGQRVIDEEGEREEK